MTDFSHDEWRGLVAELKGERPSCVNEAVQRFTASA